MRQGVKIGIIGDFDFTHNAHHATNMALDHAAGFLEIDLSYYWIRLNEALKFKPQHYYQYDGFIVAPGKIGNDFFLINLLRELCRIELPVLITGEGFKHFIEALAAIYQLGERGEKLVSENLVTGNQFERVHLSPHSNDFIQLYTNRSNEELSSCRYSIYPAAIKFLETHAIDIEAYNEFEEPEIISLKNHPFFVGCSFSPQISSTREIPHPLIYTFLKAAVIQQTRHAN